MFDLTSKPDFAATLHLMLSASEHASDPLWLISTEADPRVLKEAGMTKAEIMLVSKAVGVSTITSLINKVRQPPQTREEEIGSV